MSDTVRKTSAALIFFKERLLEAPSADRVTRCLIAVNGYCNSRCTFCNIWQYDKTQALREEITLEELERNLFSSPALTHLVDVGITGGEPFLRRDLPELCSLVYERFSQARIGVVTNGLLPERIIEVTERIVRAHPRREFSVAISLDGYGEIHDQVRGVPGNFDRVVRTVELLTARTPGVALGFSHTVTPTSLSSSLRCYELARELGVGFFYRLAHESPYLRNEGPPIWTPETLAQASVVVEELNRRILADQSLLARLGNTNYASLAFYRGTLDYFSAPRRTFDCFSGTHSFFLAHNGELHPCINLPDSIGNLRRQHFDQLWRSGCAAQIRASIAAWECHCWTNCETEQSLSRQKGVFAASWRQNLVSLRARNGHRSD